MPRATPSGTGDIYQLTVTLVDIEPPIWRRIQVPADITLARLHTVLQVTMGWLDYHLHAFRVGDVEYGRPDPEYVAMGVELKDDRRAKLSKIAPEVGTRFTYQYDFGDNWEHEIVVEEILPSEPRVRYPRVLAGGRACPPEDVGGIPGYADFLEVIGDPTDEEHEHFVEWSGGAFDPEAFDVDAKNREFDAVF